MSEWISVEDELPAEGQMVVAFHNHGDSTGWTTYCWDRWWKMNDVTHWMPLPAAPD